ncbi:UNVERIFIED_CONTAM: hypothetical protein Sradi_7012900 [Sesamum radiatum]|uniref:Reverse transcriptase domain-containing protein n=1 Tax=Sesamum radiatum TaxID=300843 RepID=A0AAW2JBR4_SESRA
MVNFSKCTKEQCIHCCLLEKRSSTKCLTTVVYGDCESTRRRLLWAYLLSLSEGITDAPWCILGDFNVIIDVSESCGRATEPTVPMAEFRDFISESALVHLPFTGCPFTWHNCSDGSRSLWRRLDRILVNEEWLERWPHSSYLSAYPSTSDHSRYIREQRKIKGNLSTNVSLAKEYLDKAQGLFDLFKDNTLFLLVQRCRAVYCKAVETEAIYVGWTASEEILELAFLQPYLKHTLTAEESADLIAPVTQSEIKAAFFDISEDSAPGPDGYTSAFYKAAWPEIGPDIIAAITEFFDSGRLLKQLNATTLVLIPKVQLPVRVAEFRPIACCNVLYKAISKIIVGRMQRVLHRLIDCSQNAFVPGRSIADNILLAQELLAGYNQVKLPNRCTIKVDIQKAYDSVHWDFILESLNIFNFPTRFISWVEQCMTTASFSVALNGSIHGFFNSSRGLRQGDPMSPYLFVIAMEIWHCLLQHRTQNDDNFQYHWKCRELGILNLGFADDVLIFCAGHLESVRVIKATLEEFAGMSGLTVNPTKSTIILSKAVQRIDTEFWSIWPSKRELCP